MEKTISRQPKLHFVLVAILLGSCTPVPRYVSCATNDAAISTPSQMPAVEVSGQRSSPGRYSFYQQGQASFYGKKFHGRQTANGEIYNMNRLTAAHKELPFNTTVRVTNLSNNKSVTVRINDRGPFVGNRIIDLSVGAAKKIDMVDDGVVTVKLEIKK